MTFDDLREELHRLALEARDAPAEDIDRIVDKAAIRLTLDPALFVAIMFGWPLD